MIKYKKGKIFEAWRKGVFDRDSYTCQHCWITDRDKLEAHHIIPWDESFELRVELTNGLTLCKMCHARHHILQPNSKMGHKAGTPAWNKGLKTGVGGPRGIKVTDEHKKKISQANKGKVWTEEQRKKLRQGKTSEYLEQNKLRYKGRSWKINIETGKREWVD
jgi:hypothetical protein